MRITKYLIIEAPSSSPHGKAKVRLVDNISKVNIPGNAVPLKIYLEIPDALFKKPTLEASIKVDQNLVTAPMVTADVVDNIRETLKKTLDFDVDVRIVED